jgi:hypothetical protein
LSAVSDEIDCVFNHLLENPSLVTELTPPQVANSYQIRSISANLLVLESESEPITHQEGFVCRRP